MAKRTMGWIKLHRKIWMSDVWKGSEPFDKRSAWVDLLLMANHEPHTINTKDGPVMIERGQFHTSIRKLARRWGWSEKKVRNYLGRTLGQSMVHTKGQGNGTTVTIENYTFYQDEGRTNGRTKGRTEGRTEGTRTRRKNKEVASESVNASPRSDDDDDLGPPIFE